MDLFERQYEHLRDRDAPLAARMRPRTLEEFIGQDGIIGAGKLLRRAIQADQLTSTIFYGPPGTGKTTFWAVSLNGLEPLGIIERGQHLAKVLRQHLPENYPSCPATSR
jgi:Holliday junction resolvasome RuvABC ATP-dependent DNA helicase subunit